MAYGKAEQNEVCNPRDTARRKVESEEMLQPITAVDAMTYNDVHINFIQEEWALLDLSQKNLYKDVMLETYMNLIAIGCNWENPEAEDHCQSSQRHERYIICHSGNKPYEHRDMERSMKEVKLERNPMNVINVVKPFIIIVLFICKKEDIVERNSMNVICSG
ncbi:zinc finger protein 120-like [Onychomys torridus]|uniref:zinc finger protein 120-like n=1 Tax=Onychomys torridus TaxID=38674 RepID=UPI00167F7040|nr:zinc finger protein 120-like [Onychomys torridus]